MQSSSEYLPSPGDQSTHYASGKELDASQQPKIATALQAIAEAIPNAAAAAAVSSSFTGQSVAKERLNEVEKLYQRIVMGEVGDADITEVAKALLQLQQSAETVSSTIRLSRSEDSPLTACLAAISLRAEQARAYLEMQPQSRLLNQFEEANKGYENAQAALNKALKEKQSLASLTPLYQEYREAFEYRGHVTEALTQAADNLERTFGKLPATVTDQAAALREMATKATAGAHSDTVSDFYSAALKADPSGAALEAEIRKLPEGLRSRAFGREVAEQLARRGGEAAAACSSRLAGEETAHDLYKALLSSGALSERAEAASDADRSAPFQIGQGAISLTISALIKGCTNLGLGKSRLVKQLKQIRTARQWLAAASLWANGKKASNAGKRLLHRPTTLTQSTQFVTTANSLARLISTPLTMAKKLPKSLANNALGKGALSILGATSKSLKDSRAGLIGMGKLLGFAGALAKWNELTEETSVNDQRKIYLNLMRRTTQLASLVLEWQGYGGAKEALAWVSLGLGGASQLMVDGRTPKTQGAPKASKPKLTDAQRLAKNFDKLRETASSSAEDHLPLIQEHLAGLKNVDPVLLAASQIKEDHQGHMQSIAGAINEHKLAEALQAYRKEFLIGLSSEDAMASTKLEGIWEETEAWSLLAMGLSAAASAREADQLLQLQQTLVECESQLSATEDPMAKDRLEKDKEALHDLIYMFSANAEANTSQAPIQGCPTLQREAFFDQARTLVSQYA